MLRGFLTNPKAALAYVAITLVGVWLFVGTEDNPGQLTQAADTFSDDGGRVDRAFGEGVLEDEKPAARKARPADKQSNSDLEYVADDELVDDAEGFDPNPWFDDEGEGEVADDGGRPYLADQPRPDRGEKPESGGWGAPPDE